MSDKQSYQIIAGVFAGKDAAGAALKQLKQDKALKLHDAAVLVKVDDANVHVKETKDAGVTKGAVIGGVLGGLLGLPLGPFGVVAIGGTGAVIGGFLTKAADMGLPNKYLDDIALELQEQDSALLLVVAPEFSDAAQKALNDLTSKVIVESVDQSLVEQLDALVQQMYKLEGTEPSLIEDDTGAAPSA